MTAPELTAAEAARVEAIEAAPAAEEALIERMARAIASAAIYVTLDNDDEWEFYLRRDEQDEYREQARAALAVVRGEVQ